MSALLVPVLMVTLPAVLFRAWAWLDEVLA